MEGFADYVALRHTGVTDEVSLAKTYRYEFNKIAKAEGIDGIIRKLEDKLAKLDAEG